MLLARDSQQFRANNKARKDEESSKSFATYAPQGPTGGSLAGNAMWEEARRKRPTCIIHLSTLGKYND